MCQICIEQTTDAAIRALQDLSNATGLPVALIIDGAEAGRTEYQGAPPVTPGTTPLFTDRDR